MIPKTTSSNNKKRYKLDYVCNNKIKSIPKKNLVTKKSLKNLDISHYNNSIEIDGKVHSTYRKINRSINQQPILSERIKRNYSNGTQKEQSYGGLYIDKNIYQMNNTEMNSFDNILGLVNNISISPKSKRKNTNTNINNIFDKNIIINNNNFDKKIIFLGESNNSFKDNKDLKMEYSKREIYPYDNDQAYLISKNSESNSELNTKNIKNNLSLNLSDPTSNNYNFKSLKNLNNSKNKKMIKENETLKVELNKYLQENKNLKQKMEKLQKNEQKTIIINDPKAPVYQKKRKRTHLSFKKNIPIKKADKHDEDYPNSIYAKTSNIINNKNNDNGVKKKWFI